MKSISVISTLVICMFLSRFLFSPVLASETRFPTVQKYYTGGEARRFGQYWGAGDRPTYEFNGDGVGDLFLVIDDTLHIMYGTTAGGFTGSVPTNVELIPDVNFCQYTVIDVNGDGLDDILTSGQFSFGLKRNQGDGTFELTGMGADAFHSYWPCWLLNPGFFMMHPAVSFDCNVDGLDDAVAYPVVDVNMPDCGPCASYLFESTMDGGFDAADTEEGECVYTEDFHFYHIFTTGDFNGDGSTDLFEGKFYLGARVCKIGPGCQFATWEQDPYLPFFPGDIRVGNFNGDSCDDFAERNNEEQMGIHVCYGDPDQITCQYYPSWGDSVWGTAHLACVADFDSDGYDDVAVQVDQLGSDGIWEVYVHYSEGSTFLDRCDTLCLRGSNYSEQSFVQMYSSDFNADGRDDLLYFVAPDTIGVLLQQGTIATFLQGFAVWLEGPGAVRIEWDVSGAADGEHFLVSRAVDGETFTGIASIPADPSRTSYDYTDTHISGLPGSDVTYRLEAISANGSSTILAEQMVTLPEAELALHQNHPNPFNPGTVISFTLPERAAVTLDIYDVAGRLVRRLAASREMDAGPREVYWDGTNDAGRPVSSGVYYCRLTAGKATVARTLVLTR